MTLWTEEGAEVTNVATTTGEVIVSGLGASFICTDSLIGLTKWKEGKGLAQIPVKVLTH